MDTPVNTKSQAKESASQAKDAASNVGQQARAGAGDVAATARNEASQLTHEATQQVRNVASEASSQARQHASTQVERGSQQLRTFAQQARALGEGNPEEAGDIGRYVQQAGQKLDEVAQRLEDGGLDGAMEDLRHFARSKPGMFLLGAGIAGFAAGRILRGAKEQQNQSSEQMIDARTPRSNYSDAELGSGQIDGEYARGTNYANELPAGTRIGSV